MVQENFLSVSTENRTELRIAHPFYGFVTKSMHVVEWKCLFSRTCESMRGSGVLSVIVVRENPARRCEAERDAAPVARSERF